MLAALLKQFQMRLFLKLQDYTEAWAKKKIRIKLFKIP